MIKPIVNDKDSIVELAERIKSHNDIIAIDTETTGLYFMEDKITGISLAFSETEGYYIPVGHVNTQNVPDRLVSQLLTLLSKKKLIYHNARFDMEFIKANYNIDMSLYSDTYLEAYLLGYTELALKTLIANLFNEDTTDFDALLSEKFGKGWKNLGYNSSHLSAEEIASYAIHDVLYTFRLFNYFKADIQKYASIFKVELNLIPIVVRMNMQGLEVNTEPLINMAKDAREHLLDLYNKMKDIIGRDFEPNSTKQVGQILFEELALPVTKRSRKTGAPSADAETLEKLAYINDFPKYLVEYRSVQKLISAYLEKIPELVLKNEDKKIYASLNSVGAESGRFTCPGVKDSRQQDRTLNMQNQPGDDSQFNVRGCYIAPEGFTFVKADFSQIEYRMMCNLAQETAGIEKFKQGVDFHTATARLMLGIPDDREITHAERQIGKVLNFGISYGMQVKTIAKRINRSEQEAEQLYQDYFKALPKLRDFINWCTEQTRQKKIAKTFFGRIRKLDYTVLPPKLQDEYLRKSFNTTIQGSAADILKIAILRVKERVLDKYGEENVRMVMTCHDELDFYVRNKMLEEIMTEIKRAMEVPVPDTWCNFVCDVEYGESWAGNTHKDFEPEGYAPDSFTSWKDVLPAGISSWIEDPEYIVIPA